MKTEPFSTSWQTLGTVPVADLVDAKVQLHWAAQIVAAFGNALLQPQPDDSQSNLGWVDSIGALCNHSTSDGWSVGLRLADLTLLFLTPHNTIQTEIGLHGRTLQQAMEWLTVTYSKFSGAESPKPFALREYDMPSHPVGKNAVFQLNHGRLFRNSIIGMAMLTKSFVQYQRSGKKPHPFDVGRIILISPH